MELNVAAGVLADTLAEPNHPPPAPLIDVPAIRRGEKPMPTAAEMAAFKAQIDEMKAAKNRRLEALSMLTSMMSAVAESSKQVVNENEQYIKQICASLGPKKDAHPMVKEHIRTHSLAKKEASQHDAQIAAMMQYVQEKKTCQGPSPAAKVD